MFSSSFLSLQQLVTSFIPERLSRSEGGKRGEEALGGPTPILAPLTGPSEKSLFPRLPAQWKTTTMLPTPLQPVSQPQPEQPLGWLVGSWPGQEEMLQRRLQVKGGTSAQDGQAVPFMAGLPLQGQMMTGNM